MLFLVAAVTLPSQLPHPHHFFWYRIEIIRQFMKLINLIYYACLRLWFLDVETNPGLWRPVPDVCRILCCNVRGLTGNLSDLTVASSQYDTVVL